MFSMDHMFKFITYPVVWNLMTVNTKCLSLRFTPLPNTDIYRILLDSMLTECWKQFHYIVIYIPCKDKYCLYMYKDIYCRHKKNILQLNLYDYKVLRKQIATVNFLIRIWIYCLTEFSLFTCIHHIYFIDLCKIIAINVHMYEYHEQVPIYIIAQRSSAPES